MYEKEGLTIDAEYNEFFFILHIPVLDHLTKSLYLEGKAKVEEIKEFAKTIGYMSVYAAVPGGDKATEKLVEKLGLSYIGFSEGFHVYAIKLKDEEQ